MLGLRERMEENSCPWNRGGQAKRGSSCGKSVVQAADLEKRTGAPSPAILLRREGLYSSHLTTWRKAGR